MTSRRCWPATGFWRSALLLGLAVLAGCSPVPPWQRGILARPHMALEPDPLESALRSHVFDAREGAFGGVASGGGGCGCN